MKILIAVLLIAGCVAILIACSQSPGSGTVPTGTVIDQQTLTVIENLAFQYAIGQASQSLATSRLQSAYPNVSAATIQQIVSQQFARAKAKATPTPKPKK